MKLRTLKYSTLVSWRLIFGMKNLENQRGYALLIVMLTIIIFLSLSAVFMSASLNHVTQEQKVDISNQSVVAAEMGVKKIHNQLQNEFLRITPTYLGFASNEIKKFNDAVNSGQKNLNNLDSEINEIKKVISLNMAKEINLVLSSRCGLTGSMLSDSEFRSKFESNAEFSIVAIECKKISDNSPMNNEIISIDTNTSNTLKNYSVQSVDKNLVVTGIMSGISMESNNELSFRLEYPISDLTVSDNRAVFLNPGNTNTTEYIPPNFENLFKDFINKPFCTGDIAYKECVATDTTDLSKLNNSKLLFKSANKINSSWMSDLKKSMIFSETNIELDNVNGMKNGSIIVKGNLVTGQFKGINNMYIQANGNMEIQKNANSKGLNNTIINLSGSFKAEHINMTNSFLYTNELTINKHMTLSGESKVCVYGDVKFEQNNPTLTMSPNSQIYYTGVLTPTGKRKFNKIPVKMNLEQMKTECKIENPFYQNTNKYKSILETAVYDDLIAEMNYQ